MALLQYRCDKCKIDFEEIVKASDKVFCPKCKGEVRRTYSGKVLGGIGKAAQKCSGNCKDCKGC